MQGIFGELTVTRDRALESKSFTSEGLLTPPPAHRTLEHLTFNKQRSNFWRSQTPRVYDRPVPEFELGAAPKPNVRATSLRTPAPRKSNQAHPTGKPLFPHPHFQKHLQNLYLVIGEFGFL